MQIPVLLDRSRTEALTGQLVSQLRDAIRRDMIPSGTLLPSSRRLSDQLGISRNTAVRAYDLLVLEGYAETRPASGIFAAKPPMVLQDGLVEPPPAVASPALPGTPAYAQRRLRPAGDQHRLSFDFFPGRPNAGLFPLRTWRRLLLSGLARGGANELSRHGDPGGLFDLRAALSTFLSATRGMVADPARIIITNGAQEALALAARVLLEPGAVAVTEDPCYAGAAGAFEAAGATLVGVPVDADGIRTEALPAGPAALLYLTPAHQYPTGRVLAMHRRQAVIDWARRTGCVIIEDDYDGDIRYEGSPLPAIAGAAPDRTIHIGSFTETLGGGLRLGFMVVPPALVEHIRAAKALQSHGNSWLEQAALGEFIRGGGYAAHLARLRAIYRESRDMLLATLGRHFGDVDVSGESGGLHLLWKLPPGMPEAATLEALARRARVGIYPLAAAGVVDHAGSALGRRGVVLGYAALTPRQIADGIARLSDAVDDRLDRHHDFLPELLVHEPLTVEPRPAPSRAARHPAGLGSARHPAPSLGRRLALSPAPRRRPLSGRSVTAEEPQSMAVVSGIYRYPIKGLSAQPLRGVQLEAGRPFPFDRIFALARGGVRIDPADPQWAKKGLFVMLMLEEALARVRTRLDIETMRLEIADADGTTQLTADLHTADGRAAVEDFVERLVPTLRERPTLVRSRSGHFMDKPDNVISLINLATLRNLEERWGYSLDPLRFRANVYIDGARPWEEFDWIGSSLRIGEAVLRVDRRNGRCGATNVDPWTGRRDRDLPAALRAAFGHKDLGVYLLTEQAGTVATGDAVSLAGREGLTRPGLTRPGLARPGLARPGLARPGLARPGLARPGLARPGLARIEPAPVLPASGPARFICRGCYYIYDEAAGAPSAGIAPGTRLATIDPAWRCPDCGTDIGKFRPYAGTG
jgi:GntR family transcriptional regulator/MocR family aminotransferase